MHPSRTKQKEILRPFFGLIGVVVVSVTLVAISVFVSNSAERALRERLERFHLRGAMLVFEAANRTSDLQLEVLVQTRPEPEAPGSGEGLTSNRAIHNAVYSIGIPMDSIVELHRGEPRPADPFLSTVERAAQQYDDLREVMNRGSWVAADLEAEVAALRFTLFQLDRLQTIEARALLDEIAAARSRTLRRTTLIVGFVLLVSGLLVVRILFLLRARLRESQRTERALLEREQQFQHSSKMEALGSLVGGVAHDFNNLLTVVLGNAERVQQKTDPDDPRQRNLKEVREAAERAAGLTRQLLTFSRQQAIELCVINLNLLIRDVEPMLHRLIREDIRLVLRLDAEPGTVEVDPLQMEQVLMNLSVNARDAMKSGGVLTVQTSNVRVSGKDLSSAMLPGDYVRIRVEDTGRGMTSETRSRAFDPFFTTKEPGKGTGLGLSTVHGIVTKNAGYVQLQSEVGAGTRFDVFLPLCDKPALDHRVETQRKPLAGGSETVLVAEDEPRVRELAVHALREAGYRVLAAKDGIEGLRLCAEHQGSVHLILSDVVMPGMRGPEMVKRALEHQPHARVLYFSGYAEDEVFEGDTESNAPLLRKPFKIQELLALVRQELNSPSAGETPEKAGVTVRAGS